MIAAEGGSGGAGSDSSFRAWARLFVPKSVSVLRRGYTSTHFRDDAISGLTVAIVALPLAMAIGIASGVSPAQGLFTAIVGGFLISLLGGSRLQIGGPTGAFIVVVYGVVAREGYDGLVIATLMAGVILMIAGFAKLGTYVKYVPYPVVTGFTAGIAVIIFSSQVKDLLGLRMDTPPAEFIEKWEAYWANLDNLTPAAIGVTVLSLALILGLRRWRPKLPGFLIAVVAASVLVWILALPAETIGSRFGALPNTLPAPHWPEGITLARIGQLLPDAATIAFLAGIESLLSAVVADSMTGGKHRSNMELVAQGAANVASACMGGIPATGAIARTATNVRAGGRSPMAGMLHALFLLVFMLVAAPLAAYVPLACLGAVLAIVAWNMAEWHRFVHLLRAPPGDRVVLILTFGLTVLVDLTVAIQVGVVLACILFMHRMATAVEVTTQTRLIEEDELGGQRSDVPELPSGVQAVKVRGPFFFGAVETLISTLDRIGKPPRVFILRMRDVPMIDATGANALQGFVASARKRGADVIVTGLQRQPQAVMQRLGLLDGPHRVRSAPGLTDAIDKAKRLMAGGEA